MFLPICCVLLLGNTSFKNTNHNWSDWKTSTCYRGIDFRVSRGDHNEEKNLWLWEYEFRNRYNENVTFEASIKPSYDLDCHTNLLIQIDANGIEGNMADWLAESNHVNICVNQLKVNGEGNSLL
jgi:hypothetical protein